MSKLIKIDRKLPPHELNARRNRKRAITRLPALTALPDHPGDHAHLRKPAKPHPRAI